MKKTILAIAATALLTTNVYAEVSDQGDSFWWTNNATAHQSTDVKHQEKLSTRPAGVEFFEINRQN